MSTFEIMGLIVLVGLAALVLWFWWKSPLRRCAECGSRLTITRYQTTSGPDSHCNGVWHVYHHVHCFHCKADTCNEELTFRPPEYLREDHDLALRQRSRPSR